MNKKESNDFLFCIQAKCECTELEILLKSYGIDFFNQEILIKKYFYDKLEYFIFDSCLNRVEFCEKLNDAPMLMQNINEGTYIERKNKE